jgi:hypothetical protein
MSADTMNECSVVAVLRKQVGRLRKRYFGDSESNREDDFVIAVSATIEMAELLLEQESTHFASLLSRLIPKELTSEEAEKVLPALSSASKFVMDTQASSLVQNIARVDGEDVLAAASQNSLISNTRGSICLPEHILETVFSFLTTKEKFTIRGVNKSWKKIVHEIETIRFDDVNCGTKKMNNSLLLVARNFRMKRVKVSNFREGGVHDLLCTGLLIDNLFRSAPMLKVVNLDFRDLNDLEKESIISKGGTLGLSALSRHETLEVLQLLGPRFLNMRQVADLLRPLAGLKELVLSLLTLSDDFHWQSAQSLVDVLKEMKNLENLDLGGHKLTDDHVSVLLGGVPDLRMLNLTEDCDRARLSDISLRSIAHSCPKLQSLIIAGQTASVPGIKLVLRSCPLRYLHASTMAAQFSHLKELVLASNTLLVWRWSPPKATEGGDNDLNSTHFPYLDEAILASKGRVLFYHDLVGPVNSPVNSHKYRAPSNLPRPIRLRQRATLGVWRKTRKEYFAKRRNLEVSYLWANYQDA